MPGLLDDKVALVTGGSSGIGRGTAIVFAREGAKVVVADVDEKGGDETLNGIKNSGGEAIFVNCDVSKSKDVESMVNKAVERFGSLDCAFNNAGIAGFNTTAECTEEEWDHVISINLKGVWMCMKYEIIQMLKQGKGAIVNTSSAGGLIGTPGLPAYTASKHGVMGLTKTAALEYVQAGIRVNAVCPGTVPTPLVESALKNQEIKEMLLGKHPMGRFGEVEEVAEAVLWLCSDAASYVTGIGLSVDGGVVAQ